MCILKNVMKNLLIYALLFATVFFLATQVFLISYVPSGSMEPTIKARQLVGCIRIHHQKINRYDIVIFWYNDQLLIKRVIGLPGDELVIKNHQVFVNGQKLEENYLDEPMSTADQCFLVPQNHYFVMGDNRNHSYDSRKIGFIPKKDIIAIAKLY